MCKSQMPYPVAVCFEFFFRELGYRIVKFSEQCDFVVWKRSGDRYRIRYVMAKEVDFYAKSVNECAHFHQPLDFRFFLISPVEYFIKQL